MGLKDDRLEARFGESLEKKSDGYVHELLIGRLANEIYTHYRDEQDPAAKPSSRTSSATPTRGHGARGLRLRLVEPCGNGVRFPRGEPGLARDPAGRQGTARVSRQGARRNWPRAAARAGHGLTPRRQAPALARDGPRQAPRRRLPQRPRDGEAARCARRGARDRPRRRQPGSAAVAARSGRSGRRRARSQTREKPRAVARFQGGATDRRAKSEARGMAGEGPPFHDLFRIAGRTPRTVRLAAAQGLGAGRRGGRWSCSAGILRPPRPRQAALDENQHRDYVLRAWLAPMLYGGEGGEGGCGAGATCSRPGPNASLRAGNPKTGFISARWPSPRLQAGGQPAAGTRTRAGFAATWPNVRWRCWRDDLVLATDAGARPAAVGAAGIGRGGAAHAWPRAARPRAPLALVTREDPREHDFRLGGARPGDPRRPILQPERFIWLDETGVVTRMRTRPPRWGRGAQAQPVDPAVCRLGRPAPARPASRWPTCSLLLNLIERGAGPDRREQQLQASSMAKDSLRRA